MKQIRQYLLGIVGLVVLLALGLVNAQESGTNTIEAMSVAQQGSLVNVRITFKEPLKSLPPAFSVTTPPRIAFDFANTTNSLGKASETYNEGDLRSANIVQVEDRTRVVLNLLKTMNYEASIDGRSLLLTLAPRATAESAGPVEHFAKGRQSEVPNAIRDISFRRGKDGEGRITVDLTDANAGIDIRQQGASLIVDFVKVSLPEHLRKRLDVTDFATPVLTVNTVSKGSGARMTITPRGLWEHNAYQTDSQFVIEVKPIIENPNKLVQGTRGGYQGEKLSLNFQNVDVRRLLQVIGEFTGMNMVVSDSVGGSITLILKDVPWDQALDIIMQQKGLDMRKNGNVILIAPREELATKEKLEFEAKAQISDLEPLLTESFQMNYIRAEAVQKLLVDPKQTLLSKRGSALLDDRSNMMFVKDTPSRLDDVRAMIAKVDVPARQVMIEARIVEAGDSFAKNLGIRLSWNQANRLDTARIGNARDLSGSLNSTASVNLPATPRAGSAGLLSFTLYNQRFTQFLSAEISALEADGRGKVVSSPRVMTANQVEALIEQGFELPYQVATASGATSIAFRKANLSLKVKPQITPDGKIAMALDINKDTPSASFTTGAGIAIDTRHVKTEVLVDNGGTVVIGGIYTQTTRNNTQRIPFFGDLPYIGWLFKNREVIDDKTELLVFVTPRIISENLSVR
ncbi:MAG TPA: type IV pilus secretin PilQ [Accumulibacter sp.]|uniref:type IV pilus secretin PilQ n=2 Tax=Accumulibacter sp. TaxID=2053492 RepID=UPI002BCD6440|nr:type IV pilus secretin PilQ [Accumulibacter sp.]HMV04046.1 type IV pilus secretin PilQ [Accumulibacter sp.]HMW80056.1 type IV pilus secretin PilQ [Accumulibacter sp.]HMX68915.1 type IV pilus secretin PilQ [Accumulibacter sp.]HNB66379.1 type IV pilus secretin PilQ [Accumulibacter sp.]HNC26797.1 type IV pilus secretin PilQ [Accumulibacter sp.]